MTTLKSEAFKKVSICTPTKDRSSFIPILAECIKNQSYPKHLIEWIIVDDSKQPIKPLIDSLRLELKVNYKYLSKATPIGNKRNICNELATGDIIINMDDDDFYPVERISHAVKTLSSSSCAIAGCSLLPLLYIQESSLWMAGPFWENHAIANTFAYKRELLEFTKYDDNDMQSEERAFLKDYQIKLQQLDPFQTIISIAHSSNTINKYQLRGQAECKNSVQSPYKQLHNLSKNQQEIIEEIAHVYKQAMAKI